MEEKIANGENNFTWEIYSHIRKAALKTNQKVSFVVTGPCSNLAVLIRSCPDVLQYLERVLIMGGSLGEGNITPYAEFNIWADPEAANVVLQQDIEVIMVGLDATHQIHLTEEQF